MIGIIFGVLGLVTNWVIFQKYGEPGWKGLIPIYSGYVEYSKVWSGMNGVLAGIMYVVANCVDNDSSTMMLIIAGVCAVVYLVLDIQFCAKKSAAFGKGLGMTLLLIFFPFIGNLVLGFGDAEFQGKR